MSQSSQKSQAVQKELLRIVDFYKSGDANRAHAAGLKYLKKHGKNFDVLHLLGTIESENGKLTDAKEHWKSALEISPNHLLLLNKMGSLARKLGRQDEAENIFRHAITVDGKQPEAHFNLGNCLSSRGDWLPAIQSYTNSIECNPDFALAYNNLALALQKFGRPDEAVKVLEAAIKRTPNEPKLHVNKARVLHGMSLGKAAVSFLQESLIKVGPDFELLTVLADLEASQNDFVAAHAHYIDALKLNKDSDVVHNNLGNLLQTTGNLDEAMSHYKKAIAINPSSYQALQNLCNILNVRKDYAQSLEYLNQVRAINPNSPYLNGMHMNALMHTCTWDEWEKHCYQVEEGVLNGLKTVNPFPPLAFFTDVNLLTRSAQLWSQNECPEQNVLPALQYRHREKGQKIRVGYYSADFYAHATALLMAGIFEAHDRERFEWIAFSFGPVQENALSRRVRAAFDQFVDVRNYSDRVVAQLSREMNVDIAVDLKGFTQDARTGIFAERAAPIQVNYLGFPGSMGAPYIDYIVADKTIISDELKQFYTEAVVRLPHCYQANDNKRSISEVEPSRESQGLPESGRVLCSFNNNYKITPQVFDIWMRILKRFPDCVLWLLHDNVTAVESLKREATLRGVDAERLIFAQRLQNEEHLARHCLADLFIDTFPCNAHTTASDALWTGLPMITCAGKTFASRVAASLLNTLGMPDCVSYDLKTYEKKIIDLLETPNDLFELRKRVKVGREQSPLFQTSFIAQHLEHAYDQMMSRYDAKLLPEAFDVLV